MRRFSRLVAVALIATLASSTARLSYGQTEAELAVARKLFSEGVKDEEGRDFESALEKFHKVQAVKDTARVRFRIANCLDSLGNFQQAAAAYRGAIELAEADPQAAQADVARASRERLAALEKRAPSLTLTLSARAPSDSVVELDGKRVPAAELGRPVLLDPGNHRVTAHATGAAPFETQVALSDAARFSLVIPLDPSSAAVASGTDAGAPAADAAVAPVENPSAQAILPWALIGGGAALLVGSGVTWIVRQNAISTMNTDCPDKRCPESTRDEVTSAKKRAQAMVPLTIVLAAAGAAAAGTGAFLLVRAHDHAKESAGISVRPMIGLGSGSLFVEGTFR